MEDIKLMLWGRYYKFRVDICRRFWSFENLRQGGRICSTQRGWVIFSYLAPKTISETPDGSFVDLLAGVGMCLSVCYLQFSSKLDSWRIAKHLALLDRSVHWHQYTYTYACNSEISTWLYSISCSSHIDVGEGMKKRQRCSWRFTILEEKVLANGELKSTS